LRDRLARGHAENLAGHGETAREEAAVVLREAQALGFKPLMAEAHYLLGLAQQTLGKPAAAREHLGAAAARMYARALAIGERVLTEPHPALAISLGNTAMAYRRLGRLNDAGALVDRALRNNVAVFGDRHLNVADNFEMRGLLAEASGADREALADFEKALTMRRELLPKGHAYVGTALRNLGHACLSLGLVERARAAYEEAWAIHRAKPGARSMEAAIAMAGMGRVSLARGDVNQAVRLLSDADAILTERNAGVDRVAEARLALADALWKAGTDRQRARRLAAAAHEAFATLPGLAPEREVARAWLARHPEL
jgi:tetratricopeptide (TPR) repeat protein